MTTPELYYRIFGWVDMVLNPAGTTAENRIPIHQSDSDSAHGTDPYIVIGFIPLQRRSLGQSILMTPEDKKEPGFYCSDDMYGKDDSFYAITDGALTISVDGAPAIELTGLDFTGLVSMTDIAIFLQAEINALLRAQAAAEGTDVHLVEVDYVFADSPRIYITSETKGVDSLIVLSTPTEGTDLLGVDYFGPGVTTVGVDVGTVRQMLYTDYDGSVEVRQCYGQGELLEKLENGLHLEKVLQYFGKQKFSIIRYNPTLSIPFTKLESKRTIYETIWNLVFKFYGISEQIVTPIDSIGVSGVIEDVNSSLP